MTGVLLVNMGGPLSMEEMKQFLSRMFKDPFILPFNKTIRNAISLLISNLRYKKSWKKYESIGGTPIITSTEKLVQYLNKNLKRYYDVRMAFSYSPPFIEDTLLELKHEGIMNITVIPLYPHESYTTTYSVSAEVDKVVSREKELNVRIIKEFYKHHGFIRFWSEIISEHILEKKYQHPFLLFSAHSIPKYLEKKGDPYPSSIEESAKMIAREIGIEFEISYQSGMRAGKWLTPDTKHKLKELSGLGINEIIIVPISFISENLETLYDLDQDIIPYAKNELGISAISRVKIPEAHDLFVWLLTDLVKN